MNAIRGFLAVLALAGPGLAHAEEVAPLAPAAVLQARYAAFKDQRFEPLFHRPLRI